MLFYFKEGLMLEYQSKDITELAKELIAVQAEIAPAKKDATNPFCKSRYATLNSVMEACRGALLNHGIWLTQIPVPAPEMYGPGHLALLTKLTHSKTGQWQSSLIVAPLPKNDPQGMGSALTYCRRYALTAMLGMVTDDDDGEAARVATPQAARAQRTAPTAPQAPSNQTYAPATCSQESRQQMLPQLAGVTFKIASSEDGSKCLIASGETRPHKDVLMKHGFRWNPQQKVWWRYAA